MNNIHLYLVISLILDIIIEACIETIYIIILMMMVSDVSCRCMDAVKLNAKQMRMEQNMHVKVKIISVFHKPFEKSQTVSLQKYLINSEYYSFYRMFWF